ncbi:Phosphatidylinositol 3,4,5-trisphosphate 3-phosphatase and protein-tyrosine-phosphatase pten1 [Asimina triloba]
MGTEFSKRGQEKPGSMEGFNRHVQLLSYIAGALYIRNFVSKKRRRMLVGGYDLDMSYITDRILAMSFPAERMRAMYRNPLWQVKSVLEMTHADHYKVFNLCVEESYDPSHFYGRVEVFPFDDNHVPSLSMIKLFCESVHSWLSLDEENVAVIHCMAGKGRTGLMVCAYLVYCGVPADEALKQFAEKRTTNNEGVHIIHVLDKSNECLKSLKLRIVSTASQRRYVRCWSKLLTFTRDQVDRPPTVNLPQPNSRELRRIRLHDMANLDSVVFVVSVLEEARLLGVPDQLYCPSVEVARSYCRRIKHGYERTNSPRYYLTFTENEQDDKKQENPKPRCVVQMDTESSVVYYKTCLDYYFEKPLLYPSCTYSDSSKVSITEDDTFVIGCGHGMD